MRISGTHFVIQSEDAEADRAFFRDVLGFGYVDAGSGWLISRLPIAEIAFHPADDDSNGKPHEELFLMCDDLRKAIAILRSKGVKCSKVTEARWGSVTRMKLPGGTEIGLYQPKHARP